jgi:YD repeat-containing protein
VSHVESGHTFWAFGFGAEERLQAAHTEIDRIYQLRWDLLSDLIEEGDRRGPNVKLLDVPPTA